MTVFDFVYPVHPEDLFVWPDGGWCYRSDFAGMSHRSDDFEILHEGFCKWGEFAEANGLI